MSLILKELYTETKNKYQLSLISGEKGLNRIINWVYISEDLNTADFLQGGELVITTGISCETEPDWIYAFTKAMIERHTSGLILNTGKYILPEHLTEELKQLCEESDYPLFIMPWEIHIYDISKDYYNRIFMDTQEDSSVTNAFLSVIHQDSDYTKSIHILEDHQYHASSSYCACIIDISQLSDSYQRFNYMIHSILRKENVKCQLIPQQTKLILICNEEHYDRICQLVTDLHNRLCEYKKDLSIHEGIGGQVSSLENLHDSYIQATAALAMAHFHKQPLYHYNDMGFFKLLLAVNDSVLLHAYADNLIGKIIEYDGIHNSSYSDTLRSFLLNDGSIQAVADQLFCHRNTINYRIHTLKDSFGLQLDSPVVRYNLMTAYLILDYLNLHIQ